MKSELNAGSFDLIWSDNNDNHLKQELSNCYLAIYANRNLPGEMWSTSPAFEIVWDVIINKIPELSAQVFIVIENE
jgi:hypothetical protein